MGQKFYLDKNDLNGQLERLHTNLYQMLEFAYLQDDMVSTIEFLMSAWCKENLNTLEALQQEFNELPEDTKNFYSDFDEYLDELSDGYSRWWMETFNQLSNEGKEKFIQRYRLTIACCLFSNTSDVKTIKKDIGEIEQWELIYGQ